MINPTEKYLLKTFFNEGGYVLNFSDSTFDEFTYDSIGIAIKSHYKQSKAKSLA